MKLRLLNSYLIVGNSTSWPRCLIRMALEGLSFTVYSIRPTGVARILSAGVHFVLHQKFDDLFNRHPLFHGRMRHILPATTFFISLWGCTHQIQPHVCLIPTNMPRKKMFFVTLGECTPCGPHTACCNCLTDKLKLINGSRQWEVQDEYIALTAIDSWSETTRIALY